MSNLINRNWVFGQKARLDFSTAIPAPSSDTAIDTKEGCASISDASGNLILYTDGKNVWDGLNNLRKTGLTGDSTSTQSAIIVPNPSNSAQYYIFTTAGASGGNHHVECVLIDTNNWGELNEVSVIATEAPEPDYSPTEKITAIQHVHCNSFFVLTVVQKANSEVASALGLLRVFLVSPTGVEYVEDYQLNIDVHDLGYLKGSKNGKRIAIANWVNHNVLLYPFDNLGGSIDLGGLIDVQVPQIDSVPQHPRNVYGVEFSPSSDILYYTVIGNGTNADDPSEQGYVFQCDLLNPSHPSVEIFMHKNSGSRYALGALQLGIDDRIYIAYDDEHALGYFENTNNLQGLGVGCGPFGELSLGVATCYMGLPNLIPNPCPSPCYDGACDEAINEANQTLNAKADKKKFKIIANGQMEPANCGQAFQQANLAPLFSLHWGDSDSDQFESHDTEIIYIRIRNPFNNLIYRGVKIFNIHIIPNAALPDGEDALQLIPSAIDCFEEIGPCSYVSRDFAFLIQNAIAQDYQISFDYCIEEIAIVTSSEDGSASFNIKVVAS
jgi:hypothetical protein